MINFKSDIKNIEFEMSSSIDAYELLGQYIKFSTKLGYPENLIKDSVIALAREYDREFYIDGETPITES